MEINENGLRKIVRNILMEMYDPYTDDEGLPMSSYEENDDIDERYGRLDGMYNTNNCGLVKITDYDGDFEVQGERIGSITGNEALQIKDRIDRWIEKGMNIRDAVSLAICHYANGMLNESEMPEAGTDTMFEDPMSQYGYSQMRYLKRISDSKIDRFRYMLSQCLPQAYRFRLTDDWVRACVLYAKTAKFKKFGEFAMVYGRNDRNREVLDSILGKFVEGMRFYEMVSSGGKTISEPKVRNLFRENASGKKRRNGQTKRKRGF